MIQKVPRFSLGLSTQRGKQASLKTLGFIHTAFMVVEVIKRELSTLPVKVGAFHIVDESLLVELMKVGGLKPQIIKHFTKQIVPPL